MNGIAPQPPEAAAERPVRFRARADVIALPVYFGGQQRWHLKDPVTLSHFQLKDEEYFVWGLLNGERSPSAILALCAARFAPRRLTLAHFQEFLALLHREGLVLGESFAQGDSLLERGRTKQRDARRAQWLNPLAIRFRGVNPDRFLDWLQQRLHGLFTPTAGFALLAAIVTAMALLATQWEAFIAQVPSAADFFRGDNLLWFALALAGVKITHELAHGVACKRFGAECTELGVMLLVFTPCLYCNVTDAWMLPNKWRRMLIGAAGILAELALCSVAVVVWRSTEPGFWNALAVRVILVCSVSTLLLNGNPLLRYDGYYILSDWLEIPNLQARAAEALRRLVSRLLLGVDPLAARNWSEPFPVGLAAYGLLSMLYRITVVAAVAWFLYTALVQAGMPALGGMLVMTVVAATLVQPAHSVWGWLTHPARTPLAQLPGKWRALAIVTALALVGFIPFTSSVRAPAVLRPQGVVAVYAQASGALLSSVEEGAMVTRGDILATLCDDELLRNVQELAGRLESQRQHVQNLRRQQLADAEAAAALPAAQQSLEALESQLAELKSREGSLTITSPIAGTVFPAPLRNLPARPGVLPTWNGSPLDPRNRGAFVDTGTHLCNLGDTGAMEAIVVIERESIELVRVGQPARIRLDGGPSATLEGAVVAVSEMDDDDAPKELLAAGELPVERSADGQTRLAKTSYQAVVRLDASDVKTWPGLVGRARIQVDAQSLWGRLWRFATQTFHAPI